MKIVITSIKRGISKKGQTPYTVISGISANGNVIEQFVKEDLVSSDLLNALVSPVDIHNFVEDNILVDLSFDKKGFLESIEVRK